MTDMDDAKEIPESVIDLMVKTIEKWMEVDGQLRSREGLDTTPDTHMMQIPCNFWPTHGMFKAWVDTLKSNQSALRKAELRGRANGMREAAEIAMAEKLTGVPPIEWTLEQISLVEGAVIATKNSIAQNLHIAANLLQSSTD